jgi:predicted Zn-dependent peptidase
MIQYQKFVMNNGLKVIVHTDNTTPMIALNVLYDVGARDEEESHTGFAHLFEHLMFGGSLHIPEYDAPLQVAGGENNAYTTSDLTNYYITIPKENMETAFWLESDRMLSLAFSEKSLDVQRKVVCEEFKEHYLTKPYGDAWHHLRALAYTTHPYKWLTIGKELSHIEQATLEDVKAFFKKYYHPANAILCVAGNVTLEEVKELATKWFGDIPTQEKSERNLPIEPQQTQARKLVLEKDVPVDALYKAYHVPARLAPGYHEMDLITELLSGGQSALLYNELVKNQKKFSSIECYHMGNIDAGLLVIEGKVSDQFTIEEADAAVEELITKFIADPLTEEDLQKAKNKTESLIAFEDLSLLNRANNLAFYELLGDIDGINTEWERYDAVTTARVKDQAVKIFDRNNSNTLFYKKK